MTHNFFIEVTADELATYADRTYSAIRIHNGLYLQPANDGERYFAIGRFWDGPTLGLLDLPCDFDYWTWGRVDAAELRRAQARAEAERDDADVTRLVADCARDGGWYRTKRDATAAALAAPVVPAGKKRKAQQQRRLDELKRAGRGIGAVLTQSAPRKDGA